MQDRIRRASVDDQVAITRLVHQARLNPRGLDWRRFVIAEAGDAPIGVAQVRRHPDGSRELASLAVLSEHRNRGVAGRMIDALLTDEPGEVFTLVDRRYAQHFTPMEVPAGRPRRAPQVHSATAADRPGGDSDRLAAAPPPHPPPAAAPAAPRPHRLTSPAVKTTRTGRVPRGTRQKRRAP